MIIADLLAWGDRRNNYTRNALSIPRDDVASSYVHWTFAGILLSNIIFLDFRTTVPLLRVRGDPLLSAGRTV